MTDIRLNVQTVYHLINIRLEQNRSDVRILDGVGITDASRKHNVQLIPNSIKRDKFYISMKKLENYDIDRTVYEGEKAINHVIGFGSDQLHIDSNDVIVSEDGRYCFVELARK